MKFIMKVSYIFLLLYMQLSIFASENALHHAQEEQAMHTEKLKAYTVSKKNHKKESVYKTSKKKQCNIFQSAEEYKKIYIRMFETQELEKDFDVSMKGEQDIHFDVSVMKDIYDFDEMFNPELIQKDDDTLANNK